jgi:putative ABC transport system ATP-binding protein
MRPALTSNSLLSPARPAACGNIAAALQGVRKSYRRGTAETLVLDAVDLEIGRGECVFLLGPSGSGKTTLLSIIGCLLTPDCGRVEVLGHDLSRLSSSALSRLRRDELGFVFQRFNLIRGLSALENVCVPLTLAGRRPSEAKARGLDLLQQVGLVDQAKSDPRRLSVGQCQRVAIARALAADPALILADEPTAALDAESGLQAMELLRKLTVAAGKTAVVVTHDHRILQYADRVVRIEGGGLHEAPPPRSGGAAEGEPARIRPGAAAANSLHIETFLAGAPA